MTYKYYKFPNKNLVPPTQAWPKNVSVFEIGYILNDDGVYNNVGEEIKAPTLKPGWFVNVCYQDDVNLDFVKQYETVVNSPRYKWFGQQ